MSGIDPRPRDGRPDLDDEDIFGGVPPRTSHPQLPAFEPHQHQDPYARPVTPSTGILSLSPEDQVNVWIHTDHVKVRLLARKVARSDEGIGLILSSKECDVQLTPGGQYRIQIGEERLLTVYVGGKVDFGEFFLLPFIPGVEPPVAD